MTKKLGFKNEQKLVTVGEISFGSLDMIKLVAFLKSLKQDDVHTHKQKVTWFSEKFKFYNK